MSKFQNVGVIGDGNIVGNNNHQNTNTTNNHYHNRPPRNNGAGNDDPIAIVLGLGVLVAGLVWWFFNHYNEAYYYLSIGAATSPILAFLGLFLLLLTNQIELDDGLNLVGSTLITAVLLYLVFLARDHVPSDVIQMATETKVWDFWSRLNDRGQSLVTANFSSAILLLIGTIIVHMASFRQLAYSVANTNRTGFWYKIYSATGLFKLKIVAPIVSILAALVYAALNGFFG